MSTITKSAVRQYFGFAAQIFLTASAFLALDMVYRWDSLRTDALPKAIFLTGLVMLAIFAIVSLLAALLIFLGLVRLGRWEQAWNYLWLSGLRLAVLAFLAIQNFNLIIIWAKKAFPLYRIGREGRLAALALLIGIVGVEWIVWRLIRKGRIDAADTPRRCAIIIFTITSLVVAVVAIHIILENHAALLQWFHAYGAAMFIIHLVLYWRIFSRLLNTARLFWVPAATIGFIAVVTAVVFFTFTKPQDTVYAQAQWDASRADPQVKNVIFITFDALAANRMSLYGNPRPTTPNLDALGKMSYVFDKMHSESDATVQGLTAISTGVHTYSRRMHEYGLTMLNENIVGYVPTAFKQIGWDSVYILGAPNMGDRTIFSYIAPYNAAPQSIKEWFYGNPIQFFITRLTVKYPALQTNWIGALYGDYLHGYLGRLFKLDPFEASIENSEKPGGNKYKAAQEYLASSDKQSTYLRLHLYPPHQPYHRIPPYKGRFLNDPRSYAEIFGEMTWNGPPLDPVFAKDAEKLKLMYEEYLLAVDAEFGKFLQFLKDAGLFDQSMLIISADHGHAFDKGDLFHLSKVMYEQTTRVPLIIHMPGQTKGQRISAFTSHVDLMPTIFETLGLAPPAWMEGESLWPYMRGEKLRSDQVKFSQGIPPTFQLIDRQFYKDLYTFAAYQDPYKLIYRFYGDYFAQEIPPPPAAEQFFQAYPRLELFDLRKDPQETTNLAEQGTQVRDELMEAIGQQIEKVRQFRKLIL